MQSNGGRAITQRTVDALSATLFESPGPLVSGAAVLCAVSGLVAYRLQTTIPLAGFLALFAIGLARIALLLAYRRSPDSAKRGQGMALWRRAYALGILACSGMLGVLTGASLVLYDDAVTHMVLVATAVGYGSGVAGRNAACLEVSLPQLWAILLPTAVGLAMRQSPEYEVLGAVVVVFAFGMTQIGLSINKTLLAAYQGAHERAELADRFDAALASMQQGFCLFGPDGRLVACSVSLGTLLRIPVPVPGEDTATISAACAAAGTVATGRTPLADILAAMANSPVTDRREVALADGRTLSLAASPKAEGGCVILLDDVSERVAAARDLERLARHDALTGLLNRASAGDCIDATLRTEEPVSVLLVDLDRFKGVNDAFGHAVGDGLLRAVAGRLLAHLPVGASAARLGGDEFVVILPRSAGDAVRLARKLALVLGQPYAVEGRELSVGASVGLATSPRDGTAADTLIRNADTALYQVKSEGRQGWRAFDRRMEEAVHARRETEADLGEAIATGQFRVVYQPQTNLSTGACDTYEALVRWEHPTRGFVPPSDFISVAEETGLIHGIGRIVLEESCRAAAAWERPVRVAVNISPVQFRKDLPGMVAAALRASGLPADRLELEVTESVFLESRDDVLAAFWRLREMGVRISLDDFGSGYSSLGYLRAFPFQKVKVDRSFVCGIEHPGEGRAVVRAVVGLGRDLGMQVVVEGVETREQLAAVRELGCDIVQGYLLSRPLAGSDASERIASGSSYLPVAA